MLQALKHRGPDSTGFGLYGDSHPDHYVARLKFAEEADMKRHGVEKLLAERKQTADETLKSLGAEVMSAEGVTDYAFRYELRYSGELRELADELEAVDGTEILSMGNSLELVKDLGDAERVAGKYGLQSFKGTHAIGHTRMATESDVDISSAHPYWAYPFSDISVVHNGQLTNYWTKRRALERTGHRFKSSCDSELIAVYIADRLTRGDELEEAMERSISELDGVFTYVVGTANALGMAKDLMAAKPMVLCETDDFVALGSEEVAIRRLFNEEIDTFDPYEGEVLVWRT
jgi:methylamine---glutamate N-methyltransferase subunit A